MYKILNENKYVTQQHTTTELPAPDLEQAHTECGRVKTSLKPPSSPGTVV